MANAVLDSLIKFLKEDTFFVWMIGSLTIEKQASAIGKGDLFKNSILIKSFRPIGGICLKPVANDN
jgi:hypothetical protein